MEDSMASPERNLRGCVQRGQSLEGSNEDGRWKMEDRDPCRFIRRVNEILRLDARSSFKKTPAGLSGR
jgi:hypothetical protein